MAVVIPKITKEQQDLVIFAHRIVSKNPAAALKAAEEYSKEFLAILKGSGGSGRGYDPELLENSETVEVDIPQQIERMVLDIQALKQDMASLEPNEKAALLKAEIALLEKWVSLKERSQNLKEMSEFQQTVISFMDEILTPDQNTEFLKRLKGFKS